MKEVPCLAHYVKGFVYSSEQRCKTRSIIPILQIRKLRLSELGSAPHLSGSSSHAVCTALHTTPPWDPAASNLTLPLSQLLPRPHSTLRPHHTWPVPILTPQFPFLGLPPQPSPSPWVLLIPPFVSHKAPTSSPAPVQEHPSSPLASSWPQPHF